MLKTIILGLSGIIPSTVETLNAVENIEIIEVEKSQSSALESILNIKFYQLNDYDGILIIPDTSWGSVVDHVYMTELHSQDVQTRFDYIPP
jgi:hypothetical protein